jgi:anaerobic selenocysteine-containing dehydrogenase
MDETTAMADLVLPDRIYLEDWGSDIPDPAPGYQVLGIQQPVVNPLSDLDPRSFCDILLSTAQELGHDGDLPWDSLQAALRETSDALFALNRGSVKATSAGEFWNNLLRQGGWWDERETGPTPSTPNGLYNQIASRAAQPSYSGEGMYLMPFSHNTLLDGRNTHLPWAQAAPDPLTTIAWQSWVEMNQRRMEEMGLREGDIVQVQASQGSITAPVYPNPAMRPDVVGIPLGQGRRNGPEYATAGDERESSNVLSILAASQVEGTGALAWASNRVQISATGQSMRLVKFEGEFTSREIGNQIDNNPAEEIIKTTSPGEHH